VRCERDMVREGGRHKILWCSGEGIAKYGILGFLAWGVQYKRVNENRKEEKMKTKTKTGLKVELKAVKGQIRATFDHPKVGHLSLPVTWGTYKGNEGLIGMTRINGKETRVVLTIPKPDWDSFKSGLRERVTNAPIIGVTYIMGCDTSDTYSIKYGGIDDIPHKYVWEREEKEVNLLKEFLRHPPEEIFLHAEKIPTTFASYGGWKWEGNALTDLLEALRVYQENEAWKKLQAQAEKENRLKDLLRKAKETGEPQIISRQIADCQNPAETGYECSFDEVVKLAMPDGTIKTISNHCY